MLAVNKLEMKPTRGGECCARAENCSREAQRIFSLLGSFARSFHHSILGSLFSIRSSAHRRRRCSASAVALTLQKLLSWL